MIEDRKKVLRKVWPMILKIISDTDVETIAAQPMTDGKDHTEFSYGAMSIRPRIRTENGDFMLSYRLLVDIADVETATTKIASGSLGVIVIIRFMPDSEFYKNGVTEQTHRNVTKIYCINHESGIDSFSARISLASDVHHTGCSYKLSDVRSYCIVTETERADNF